MKWRCDNCGFETPKHPRTWQALMPLCDQYVLLPLISKVPEDFRDHTGKFIKKGTCGGTFRELP